MHYFSDYNGLLTNNISLQRYSKCACRPNTYGHRLLELCIYIANSRIGNDKTVGKITCNDVSVVDYLILSSDLFQMTKNFEVEEFNPILSDVHCNLKFTLESQPYTNINNVKTVEKQVIKWNNNKQDKFVKEKKSEGIRDIETILDKLIDRNDTVQQTDIDTAMNKICEIFNSSSISVFGTKCKNQKYAKHNEKPWYKRGCKKQKKFISSG
ncbi:unnamed protein product [Mytilus edulis]|uniref:Uncharacterized protein n=1 Tax=Mytilus edulis TaxID=6550 RepID=A0A8S3SM22_MYTED|nr:unnamed protein product [Mytilus edulis]